MTKAPTGAWTVVQNDVQFCFYHHRGVAIRSDGTVEEFEVLNPTELDSRAYQKLLIEPAREIERKNRENRVSAEPATARAFAADERDDREILPAMKPPGRD
jgi:hypothetical protein